MIAEFPIPQLFEQFFGISPRFDAEALPIPSQSAKLGSPYYAQDALGRNYFMPVKLGDLELPLPVIRINARKNIVETTMVNRQGTVKELISVDDYKISIRGICLGNSQQWPEELVAGLQDLFALNKAVSIRCPLTDIFLKTKARGGSDKAVITHLDILETKGFKGVVPYQIDLISDSEFVLEL